MQILTAFALLIPAFSLLYTPQPLTLLFLRVYNAPLPNPLLDCLSFGEMCIRDSVHTARHTMRAGGTRSR